jgi:hypothetical protein
MSGWPPGSGARQAGAANRCQHANYTLMGETDGAGQLCHDCYPRW